MTTQTSEPMLITSGRTEIHFAKKSEDQDKEAVLVSRVVREGRVDEKLMVLRRRELGGPWQTVVEIDTDGVEHFGEGHDADSAAKHLYEVIVSALPELRDWAAR